MRRVLSRLKQLILALWDRLWAYGRDCWWAITSGPAWPVNAPADSLEVEQLVQHWQEHGWVLLKASVATEAVDHLGQEIERFRKRGRGGSDEKGFGLRIGLLHVINRTSLRVAQNPQVLSFLRRIWPDTNPVLFGTLTFDIGSEQESHIDAAFFYTRPEDGMVGVWTALEDIHPDSGPLFYIDKSHRLPRLYSEQVLAAHPDLARRVQAHRQSGAKPDHVLSNEVYEAYSAMLGERIAQLDLPRVPALIEKGDVFIWDGWIIHGGLPRLDRELSRKSMVAHFIREDAVFWDQHEFFLRGDELEERRAENFRLRSYRGERYIKYDNAVTFDAGDGHFKA